MEGRKVVESEVRKDAFSPSPCLPNPPPLLFIHALLSPSLSLLLPLPAPLLLPRRAPQRTHKKDPGNDVIEENDWSVYLMAGNLCFAGVSSGI